MTIRVACSPQSFCACKCKRTFRRTTGAPLASVERYNVNEDRWEEQDPLAAPREGLQMVAIDDGLLAVGGWMYGKGHVSTVERYE